MKRTVFIPLDDRPVCYDLPLMISGLDKNNEIFIPQREILGNLTKSADTEKIFEFLSGIKSADIIVVSLDTIAYGGLIPSRRSEDSLETIKKRIDKFIAITEKLNARVYAFSSIMRISNNNINEEEKYYWKDWGKKIFEYSCETHRTGNAVKTDVPEDILNDYINTRKRNFEINKYYIELQKNNMFDTLIFSKDDCAEFGFNVFEASELEKLSSGKENILIKTGADEIPLTLLSRALNYEKKIKIAPLFINPEYVNKISKYEDIDVRSSVKSQIETAGALQSSFDDCDMVMIVNNFKDEQGELVMNVDVPLFDSDLKIPEKPWFVADILNANGADNNFVEKLFEKNLKEKFYGYAAWNTTGNTLGSAIAAALTYFCARTPDNCMFKNLLITRFLDDWAYQANVRKNIRNNPDNLKNDIIKPEMLPFERKLETVLKFNSSDIEYYFPWNRFFETGIRIKSRNPY